MRYSIAFTILLLLILPAKFVLGDAPEIRSNRAAAKATGEEILKWINQLDADAFAVRETATQRLIKAESIAIDPIKKALAAGSLEVTTRGIFILRELALSTDMSTEQAARAALESVADARVTAAARRATSTLKTLNNLRQTRSIDRLERLGAKIDKSQINGGFQMVEAIYAISIDEDWKGKDDDLRLLQWLQDIREVNLVGSKVKDDWLAQVVKMPNLSKIAVKKARITDDAIEHLKKLEHLDELDLFYVPLKDSAADILRNVHSRVIKLYGTRIQKDTADKLREDLESTTIDFRRGAFLGVGCQDLPEGCAIGVVHPTSAAARAGLQERDIIASYEGSAVTDFDTLTALISEHAPGDKVTMEILRGGERHKKEIVLGEWE